MLDFVTSLWPSGPYAATLTVALVVALVLAVLSKKRAYLWPIVVGFILNWFFVRWATNLNAPGVAAIGHTLAGFIMLAGQTALGALIASIYVPRVLLLLAGALAALPMWLVWELSNALLIVQIALMVGGSTNAHFTRGLCNPCLRFEPRNLFALFRRDHKPTGS